MMTQVRYMLYEVIMDFWAGISVANNEALVAQIIPADLFASRQAVSLGHDSEDPLIPEGS